jgi:hypothetical protein
MFYELLVGKKPFEAETIMEMFRLHNEGTFKRPAQKVLDIPVWLDTLVCQLLEKKPDKRPLDAAMVGQALERVKDKVLAQQSAGIEAAKTRKVDRSDLQPALDETDKEAARTLLRRKKKKKVVPFYRKVWFQGVALTALLATVSFVFYSVFIKPPSADSLIQQIDELWPTDKREARKGPIKEFLIYYPEHTRASKYREWADEYDRDHLEKQMLNRRTSNFAVGSEAERLFRLGLDQDARGRLKEAQNTWNELKSHDVPSDPEERWGLLADKYLQVYKAADDLYGDLKKAVRFRKAESDEERVAFDAVRAEQSGQFEKAKEFWSDLKTNTQGNAEKRRWFVLAVKREQTLEEAAPKSTD